MFRRPRRRPSARTGRRIDTRPATHIVTVSTEFLRYRAECRAWQMRFL
jgi:hypothetical protein